MALALYLFLPWRLGIVRGSSMTPCLRSGQFYVLDTGYYRKHPLRRGDVIVFRYEGETLTKRVYAVPGDVVPVLYHYATREYEILPLAVAEHLRRRDRRIWRACRCQLVHLSIPEGYCFVLGDHRDTSYDSRDFGLLPVECILGKMVMPSGPAPQQGV